MGERREAVVRHFVGFFVKKKIKYSFFSKNIEQMLCVLPIMIGIWEYKVNTDGTSTIRKRKQRPHSVVADNEIPYDTIIYSKFSVDLKTFGPALRTDLRVR